MKDLIKQRAGATVAEPLVDFNVLFNKAVELFTDQASLTNTGEEVTLRDLETKRLKATNFLDGINGLIELQHQLEVIQEEKHKFKRKDELATLNTLRETVHRQSEILQKHVDVTYYKLEELMKSLDKDFEDDDKRLAQVDKIALIQEILDKQVTTGQRIIAGISRLIQLERFSGSRPFGIARQGSTSISLIEGLESKEEGVPEKTPPRQLTEEEMRDRGIIKSG